MKAFIRFKKATDGMYFAIIDPDFNVLPLIFRFFKNRYADQRWLIYDVKRNYGLMYTLQEVVEVKLLPLEKQALATTEVIAFDEDEVYY
jgi:probable DNA metabolism protein